MYVVLLAPVEEVFVVEVGMNLWGTQSRGTQRTRQYSSGGRGDLIRLEIYDYPSSCASPWSSHNTGRLLERSQC